MPTVIESKEGRFARLEAIEWWDQALMARARVLVIGAGALGNEVVKNLALLGIGHVVVVDLDRVEESNLSRSVLFRPEDEGLPKAECAARAARGIFGGAKVHAVVGSVLTDVGLGYFRWADAVIGALDNREARVFVNAACARMGRPWFDGGIEVLSGVARGFAPPATACYECTMSQVDWDVLNRRRSCSLLARRAITNRGTPTTPTTASIIAGIQVQEMVKHLHGRPALLGQGIAFEGGGPEAFRITYPISPECPWHEKPAPVDASAGFDSDTPLARIAADARQRLGGLDAVDFSREIVARMDCLACGTSEPVFQPADKVLAEQLHCRRCGAEGSPVFMNSVASGSPLLELGARALGLPAWDVVWARRGNETLGYELSGDQPLGAEAETALTTVLQP